MNEKIIYKADIKATFFKKAAIVGIILFVIVAIIGCIPDTYGDTIFKYVDYKFFFLYTGARSEYADGIELSRYSEEADNFMVLMGCLIGLGCLIICTFPLWFYGIGKFISSRCALTLEEGQIKGQLKTLFGKKSLQLPLDHLDNVMVSHGLMDKLRGGKTLLISSNRGLIKFHYVQNADEFARVAMEKIEEVKKKTFHNPAPAPTTAPAQPTGNDTMEKLDSLKKMLENGLITQKEFEAKRKELLEKL